MTESSFLLRWGKNIIYQEKDERPRVTITFHKDDCDMTFVFLYRRINIAWLAYVQHRVMSTNNLQRNSSTEMLVSQQFITPDDISSVVSQSAAGSGFRLLGSSHFLSLLAKRSAYLILIILQTSSE